MNRDDFVELMEAIAESWIAGDTRRALELFTEDAVYMEPPDEQRYEGREELFEFFGGDDPPPMQLRWHHLVVDGDVGPPNTRSAGTASTTASRSSTCGMARVGWHYRALVFSENL